jgi:hypothetical protein
MHDLPGAGAFFDSTPGVIGIADHFSMLLADKRDAWDGLLDGVAELTAVRHALRGVGVVLRPAASTGPQCPEWGELTRFARMTLAIAEEQSREQDQDSIAPSALAEIDDEQAERLMRKLTSRQLRRLRGIAGASLELPKPNRPDLGITPEDLIVACDVALGYDALENEDEDERHALIETYHRSCAEAWKRRPLRKPQARRGSQPSTMAKVLAERKRKR